MMELRIGIGSVLIDLVTEELEQEIITGDQDQGQALEEEGEVTIEVIRGEVVRAPEVGVGVGVQRDIVKMTVIEDNNDNSNYDNAYHIEPSSKQEAKFETRSWR